MYMIGNDELAAKPALNRITRCPGCGERHVVRNKASDDGRITLSVVICPMNDGMYLVGFNGKELGELPEERS